MCGNAALEALEPLPIAEHGEVLIEERATSLIHDLPDFFSLVGVGKPDTRPHDLRDSLITPVSAEDEENCWQEVLFIEHVNDGGSVHARASPGIEPRPTRCRG